MNVVLLALLAWFGIEDTLHPPQMRIEIAVYSGDPLGSVAKGTIKSLAEPNLTALNGQTGTFLIGTTLTVPTGVKLEFTTTARPDGTVRMERRFTLYQRNSTSGDVQSKGCEANEVVKLGEKVRVRITADAPDSQTWVEFTVTREPRGK